MSTEHDKWIATAKSMGEDAGREQGKWAADGNTTDEHRRKVLTMLDAGDPEAHDYLPNEPNLSGEWADDLTPSRLYETITGKSAAPTDSDWTEADGNLCDALCAAWEEGVSETFVSACEAELMSTLDPPHVPIGATQDGYEKTEFEGHTAIRRQQTDK